MDIPNIHKFDRFALDTETTGLQYKEDKVFGVSVSTPDGKDYYWDVRNEPRILEWLDDEVSGHKGKLIYANASFDIRMFEHVGVHLNGCDTHDVIIRASCINEHLPTYTLDYLSQKYLGEKKVSEIYEELAALFGGRATRNVQMPNLHRAPVDLVAPYAKKDTRLTLELWDWQEKEINRQDISRIVDFEQSLIRTFVGMEMHGIRVDQDYAERAISKLDPVINEEQDKINKIFGTEVNVNSSPQIKSLYAPSQLVNGDWIANDGTPLEKTKTGNASLDATALRKMSHKGAKMILEHRSLLKTRDTFLMSHVLKSTINGRVYPTINQSQTGDAGTGTGRLSIQKPAMQQIPSRNKEVAAIVKPCFLPEEGHVWVDADMASFEVRVFAHLAADASVIEAYKQNPELDFHQFVAELTNLVRNATYSGQPNAKQLNLSMIFNAGNGHIADEMGMPWEWAEFTSREGEHVRYQKAGPEATDVINTYHRKLPGVKQLAEGAARKAKNRGYVFTKYGRRLRFPNKRFAYKASGLLIQATSADINKENIQIITEVMDGQGHLLLNTHDSYSMSIPEHMWEDKFNAVKAAIERPVLNVPLILGLSGVGQNWWQAVKKE